MSQPARRAPLSPVPLPASGAWRPGDPVGARRFVELSTDRDFVLEGGGHLPGVTVAYETWGELADDRSNAVLVCHALTGDSHAAGGSGAGHPSPGWWDALIGPGAAIDTDRWFVVCANVLGGCQGSTGPSSIDRRTGRPFGANFPVVTIRDMVRVQAGLADALGVRVWHSVIGGSMGGMQALEWAVMYPERVRSVVALATTFAATAWQIGFSSVQRSAIAFDPNWNGGDYYDAPDEQGPHRGLALAREIAHMTYRTESVFDQRFGRRERDLMEDEFTLWQQYDVEGYLDHQGSKLVQRFDANSYLVINRAMDLHDVARGRGGLEAAAARITASVLTVAIDSDTLYPPRLQREIHEVITAVGGRSRFVELACPDGHDGFLTGTDLVGAAIAPFLREIEYDR